MKYSLVIQPEAEADLDEVYRWYEEQRSGLGSEFIECVEAVLDRIAARRRVSSCPAATGRSPRAEFRSDRVRAEVKTVAPECIFDGKGCFPRTVCPPQR